MSNAKFEVPFPPNDPICDYLPGSPERASLKKRYAELKNQKIEIPLIIGGKEIKTGDLGECVLPHDHKHVIGVYHKAGTKEVNMAIEAALEARKLWSELPWEDRVAVFLKAADLLTTPYWRDTLNAATMLNQSKNPFQAEIDAACKLLISGDSTHITHSRFLKNSRCILQTECGTDLNTDRLKDLSFQLLLLILHLLELICVPLRQWSETLFCTNQHQARFTLNTGL